MFLKSKKFLKSFPDRPTEISPDRKCFLKSKKFLKSFPDLPTKILCEKLEKKMQTIFLFWPWSAFENTGQRHSSASGTTTNSMEKNIN